MKKLLQLYFRVLKNIISNWRMDFWKLGNQIYNWRIRFLKVKNQISFWRLYFFKQKSIIYKLGLLFKEFIYNNNLVEILLEVINFIFGLFF